MKIRIAFVGLLCSLSLVALAADSSWIRINQLGYTIHGKKQAVWCSKEKTAPARFEIIHHLTGRKVYQGKADTSFGAYGPFKRTARIDFSAVQWISLDEWVGIPLPTRVVVSIFYSRPCLRRWLLTHLIFISLMP